MLYKSALLLVQFLITQKIDAFATTSQSCRTGSRSESWHVGSITRHSKPLYHRKESLKQSKLGRNQIAAPLYSTVPTKEQSFDLTLVKTLLRDEEAEPTPAAKFQSSSWAPIISVALLMTGNTVGAGTMVLPQVAGSVGMLYALPIFLGLYGINLLSGSVISEVAIQQFERQTPESDIQDPSSLKDLSDITLGKFGGNLVAGTSVLTNWCVLAYCLIRSGELINQISGGIGDGSVISVVYSALVAGLVTTLSNQSLSKISALAVAVLFASFAGLIIPGLTSMQDPLLTLMAPGTYLENGGDTNLIHAILAVVPIVLQCMIFQNIVPTVTKMLNYDRSAVRTSMLIGSGIPVLMYLSWCFTSLGGGIEDLGSMDMTSSLLHAFGMASVVGSSVAGTMGLSNEFQSFLSRYYAGDDHKAPPQDRPTLVADHSPISVGLAITPPLLAGLAFSGGESFTQSLSLAGQFGSPILYGIVPVLMALTQVMNDEAKTKTQRLMYKSSNSGVASQFKLPGGFAGLASLGACSLGYMGQQMFASVMS